MPTYRNDAVIGTYSIKNSLGKTVDVAPGESVQTFALLGFPFIQTDPLPLATTLRDRPTIGSCTIPSISGIKIFSGPTMDGSLFKAIALTVDSKCIKIQASNGVANDFTSFAANPPTFHFALTGTPAPGEWTQHIGELNFDLEAPSGTIIGYVRAATGVVVSVTVGA